LENRNLNRTCRKIEKRKRGDPFNDWWQVDTRRLEYNKEIADQLLKYDWSHLIHEILPVKEKSFVFVTAIDKRANPDVWDFGDRIQTSWSYARTHGYGAYYCIVEELTEEFVDMLDKITFSWEVEIWEPLCTFLVALNNPDITWTFFHDQDSFINPKYFNISLEYYMPKKLNDDYIAAVSDDPILELGVYFVRNNPAGIAFMLTFLLEMQLNIWVTHKMILSKKFAFRSILMDYLDLGLHMPVHHRLRAHLGTILHGAVSTHYYNWNDASKWIFDNEYRFKFPKLSDYNDKTKPFYHIYSPTKKEMDNSEEKITYISFAHRNGKFQSMFVADPEGRKGRLQEWMKEWIVSDFPKSCVGISGSPCMRWNFSKEITKALKLTNKERDIRARSTDIQDFGLRKRKR